MTLDVVQANPIAEGVVTWFGFIVLALVAGVIAGVWIVRAGMLARRSVQVAQEGSDDAALETLRHQHIVVDNANDKQGPTVAQLAPDGPAEPVKQPGPRTSRSPTPTGSYTRPASQ